MRRKPYPLEIVEKIRSAEQAVARVALEQLRVRLEYAEIQLQQARKAAIDHERAIWRFETKRTIPKEGCSASDLQREANFALGLSDRERRLKDQVVRAQNACNRLRLEVDTLQNELRRSQTALEAVERHHQRFDSDRRRERANQAELDKDDLYSIPR